MDPVRDPFAPGAGTPPPELAGRNELQEGVRVALERVRLGRPAKSVLMAGLRGVGKTVLLDRMREDAEASGIQTIASRLLRVARFPRCSHRSFVSLSSSRARRRRQSTWRNVDFGRSRDLHGRSSSSLETSRSGLDLDPEAGLADNGDLEQDLPMLLETLGQAARAAGTASVSFLDELQYVPETQLAALITQPYRSFSRRRMGTHTFSRSGENTPGIARPHCFTVPLFDEFMRRSIPGEDWRD